MPSKFNTNPSIVQTICQINFTPRESTEGWDGKWFGRFLTALGSDYDMEPISAPAYMMQNNPQGGPPRMVQDPMGSLQMIYKHKNQKSFIQLAPWTVLMINMGPHEGWKTLETQYKKIWATFCSVVNPSTIARIGLRYINRIPRTDAREKISDWLRPTDLIPHRIASQTSKFIFRCEIPEDEKTKLILGIAEEQVNLPVLPIIFDLDVIHMKNISAELNSLEPVLNHIHGILRVEFDHTITPKYKAFLEK